jgi:hypothetical protein
LGRGAFDDRRTGDDLLTLARFDASTLRDDVDVFGTVVGDDEYRAALALVLAQRTTPEVRARMALFFGLRASNNSTTRGDHRRCRSGDTPVWKVRIVSCVPARRSTGPR